MSGIIFSKLLDHSPVFTFQEIFKSQITTPKFVKFQIKTKAATDSFVEYVGTKLNESNFYNDLAKDPNMNYNTLEGILLEANTKFFPIEHKSFNRYKHKINPWITMVLCSL